MTRKFAAVLAVVPALLCACGPETAEPSAPEANVEEVSAVEQKVVNLSGSGYIINTSTNRIRYDVVLTGDNTKAVFVLRTVNNITWWKSLSLFPYVNGGYGTEAKRIETKDSVTEVSVDYFAGEMTDSYKVEFWKAGFMGVGAYVTALELGRSTSVGKKYIFTWEQD